MTLSRQLDLAPGSGRRVFDLPPVGGEWVDLAHETTPHVDLSHEDREELQAASDSGDAQLIELVANGIADRASSPELARAARSLALRAGETVAVELADAREAVSTIDLSKITDPEGDDMHDLSALMKSWGASFAEPGTEPGEGGARPRPAVVQDRWAKPREIGSDAEFETVMGERHGRVLRSGLGADRDGADPDRPIRGGAVVVHPDRHGYTRHGVALSHEQAEGPAGHDEDEAWVANARERYYFG